jgi:trimeric autotransporter adhesin
MKKKLILIFSILANISFVNAQWNLTGNAGINPPTNFLGTTDATKLIFKVNGQQAGSLDYNSAIGNTAFGYQSSLSTTGNVNTAIGYQALYSNTSGSNNDGFGFSALYSNTTANANSAFGNYALYTNTTGKNDYAFGCFALYSNTTGNYNIANGGFSLYNNTSGGSNTACGYRALSGNTTAVDNTAMGFESLYSNTKGSSNTATGFQALYTNSTGFSTTAVGYQALYVTDGSESNTAFGALALAGTTTGSVNTATGYQALVANNTGSSNTAVGRYALSSNTTGNGNTSIGEEALISNTTGNFNTALGMGADVNAGNYTQATSIGYAATSTASYQIRIGNSSVTSIGGYANWSNISDGRFKKNVKENVPGLEFISMLRPITYTLDITGINKFIHPSPPKGPNSAQLTPSTDENDATSKKEKIVYSGFVAQEVEAAANKIGYDFSGVDAPKSDKDLYSLRYAEFVVPLAKSVQELTSIQDGLKARVGALQSKVNDMLQTLSSK